MPGSDSLDELGKFRYRTGMVRPLKSLLPIGALILAAGCASDALRFASAEVSITALRGTQPAAHEQLVVWIGEHRLEGVTDANGRFDITENYTLTAQVFSVPPVGSLGHSPQPTVAVSLASDPGRQFDGERTATSEPGDLWKIGIRVDLSQGP